MLNIYILVSALVVSSSAVFAYNPIDSIGVENNNGKKLILHKVDPKESYFSISRRYQINVKSLQDYNKNVSLQIGTILRVPTDLPYTEKASGNSPTITPTSFFEYTVAAKDNLNLIAERYATTVNEIKTLNHLNTNNLSIGQVLKVPFTKTGSGKPAETSAVAAPSPITTTLPANSVTEHTVKPKEYLGVIAKAYGVSVEDLKALNGLTSNNLKIGQVLKIPTSTVGSVTEPVENSKTTVAATPLPVPVQNQPATPVAPQKNIEKKEPTFEHIVAHGETIYAIAQKYGLTTYQLKTYNDLTSNNLSTGQKLIIKGEKPAAAVNDSTATDGELADGTTLKNPDLKRPAAVYGLNHIEEKGTGTWITDPDLDPSKMLILHRLAPVGTIIQVTNPMTNRSTFAKVVGKFTENETTKDVIIVMTKAVADAIGALDKRFFCNLSYGPKE